MTWGNPEAVSFEKRHIRMVVVDHHRVKVHRSLAPIVERILLDLAKQGLTAQTAGWEPGADCRRFRIEVDGLTPERVAVVMERYGFRPSGTEFWFEWDSDTPPEDSEAPQDALGGDEAPRRTQTPKRVARKPPRGDQRLGSRPLQVGDEGLDVLTLQVFLGAPRTGVYDEETAEAVRSFHARKGATSDGSMSLAAQAWIIPRTVERLRTGAAGLTVMLLTAALIAKRVLDPDAPVQPRYTVSLANTVRSYRESIGLPRSEVVDSPTWASLVDQPRRA